MSRSTIAAIIPCYNGEQFLGQAIESILRQTRPVDEILVVDDCSTDASAEIARRYPVRILRTPRNRGEAAARNLGIRQVGCDLIAWLDADDYWEPHHVETVAGLLDRYPEATVAFGATQRFGLRNETIFGYIPPGEPKNVFWLALQDWIHTTISSITRRDVLLEIGGFDESERYSVDYDVWLRLARKHLFVATHEVTAHWRWHADQLSQSQRKQLAAVYRFRRKLFDTVRGEGDPVFTRKVEEAIQIAWKTDMSRAWERGDLESYRFFYALHRLVPGTSFLTHYRWAAKSLMPAAARRLLGVATADQR